MIITIAAAERMIIYDLDMSNAFQTNIEEKPYEREYIFQYLNSTLNIFGKWPDHPLLGTPTNELCIRGLKSIQGTKPAGRPTARPSHLGPTY
eukprot:10710319-Ditylum_brightwellii.AAC.1